VVEKRQIAIRLIHDGVQPGTPLDEPMRFGVQDTKGGVHPGLTGPCDACPFDLSATHWELVEIEKQIRDFNSEAQRVFEGTWTIPIASVR
jgi:hypothetical protein